VGVVETVCSVDSIRIHSDGSEKLVSQFQSGADADLLLLADATLVESIQTERKFSTSVIAGNSLVLAARSDKPMTMEALSDPLINLALADPKTAPLGRYSEQALAEIPVAARKVYLKDATAVLTALRLGHAQVGIVYASDLSRFSGLSEVAKLDSNDHDPIRYAAVLLEPAHPEALSLYQSLTSERGRQALEKAGFTALSEPPGQ
jgi:molybdate transport system substrate-binding protein